MMRFFGKNKSPLDVPTKIESLVDNVVAFNGMKIFSRVSSEYPANFFGQPARIVQLCRIEGFDVEETGHSLFNSNPHINHLQLQANSAHHERNKRLLPGEVPIKTVSSDDVKNVLKQDFNWAKRFEILSDEDLQRAINISHYYRDNAFIDAPGMNPVQNERFEIMLLLYERAILLDPSITSDWESLFRFLPKINFENINPNTD